MFFYDMLNMLLPMLAIICIVRFACLLLSVWLILYVVLNVPYKLVMIHTYVVFAYLYNTHKYVGFDRFYALAVICVAQYVLCFYYM